MTEYPDHVRIAQKLLDQQGDINRLTAERDGAYRERAQILAPLAALHPSVIAPAPDVDEDGWQILYLRIGGKQASWHIAPRDAHLFTHVEHVTVDDPRAQWDGHTTEEKYAGIAAHTAELEKQRSPEAAVERVRHLRDRWVHAGPPPLGASIARWWDARLIELNAALNEPKEPCGAGIQAPNALGNERCTLPAGHDGRHADGILTWPRAAGEPKEH
jgi:hypothetical protein